MASSASKQALNPHEFAQQLQHLAEQYHIRTWCLAYSGGVDSQVLLHLLYLSGVEVYAVYIDHGLQAASSDWAKHCEQQCQQFDIPFQCIAVNAQPQKGESPEAAARSARYSALKKIIEENTCLLTAQHLDDQAETVMLQLLRGAGAAGLAAMPSINRFSSGWHSRPLLQISQDAIVAYAQQNQLSWVEDPSNQHQQYDRNYLRHSVIPVLADRWPAMNRTLAQFADQQVENMQLLDELAKSDMAPALAEDQSLSISVLQQYDDARLRNLLRYWLKSCEAPMPSRAVLMQIVKQLMTTSHDTHSLVSWSDFEVRHFRDHLYCLKKNVHDAKQRLSFSATGEVQLPSIKCVLRMEKKLSSEQSPYVLDSAILNSSLTVRFRQGGEKILPAGRKGRRDLKSLFQEEGVPAWERERVPLLYADNELVAVVGYCIADEFAIKGEGVLPVLEAIKQS